MKIDAAKLESRELNEIVRNCNGTDITVDNCLGQRYIACGSRGKTFTVNGVAGNALGAYLDGSKIRVNGNAQDAVGDTMNDGEIVIDGSGGDAVGYAMRGGRIFVKGDVGYRAGIHMKSYKDKSPVIVVGGRAGDFLGEYQAGGTIVVLGIGTDGCNVGGCCGTGMHGGKMFIRGELPKDLPAQVRAERATDADLKEIEQLLDGFVKAFSLDSRLLDGDFFVLTPNTENPYRRMYVEN